MISQRLPLTWRMTSAEFPAPWTAVTPRAPSIRRNESRAGGKRSTINTRFLDRDCCRTSSISSLSSGLAGLAGEAFILPNLLHFAQAGNNTPQQEQKPSIFQRPEVKSAARYRTAA